jgi:hypothetical protein
VPAASLWPSPTRHSCRWQARRAAALLVGACPRGGAEIAGGTICGSAAQPHLPASETQREHEVRPWSDAPFAVGLDQEVPAVGAELDAVVSDAADLGATARVVEPQLAGGTVGKAAPDDSDGEYIPCNR